MIRDVLVLVDDWDVLDLLVLIESYEKCGLNLDQPHARLVFYPLYFGYTIMLWLYDLGFKYIKY